MTSLVGSVLFWLLAGGLLTAGAIGVAMTFDRQRHAFGGKPLPGDDFEREMELAFERLDRLEQVISMISRHAAGELSDLQSLRRDLMTAPQAVADPLLAEVLVVVCRLLEHNESLRHEVMQSLNPATAQQRAMDRGAMRSDQSAIASKAKKAKREQIPGESLPIDGGRASFVPHSKHEVAPSGRDQSLAGAGCAVAGVAERTSPQIRPDRRPYERTELMAPYVGASLPSAEMLKPVQCCEVGARSITVVLDQQPDFEMLVFRLGLGASAIDVMARVADWRTIGENHAEKWLVDCDFVGKVVL